MIGMKLTSSECRKECGAGESDQGSQYLTIGSVITSRYFRVQEQNLDSRFNCPIFCKQTLVMLEVS
jgi:hypothetical protein